MGRGFGVLVRGVELKVSLLYQNPRNMLSKWLSLRRLLVPPPVEMALPLALQGRYRL